MSFARHAFGGVRPLRRWLVLVLATLTLIGGAGWLAPTDVAAGQAGTIVSDGAPLFASSDDLTVLDWMDAGTRVDYFYGPYEWMYQVRYNGTVGWTWMENVQLEGEGPAVGSSSAEAPAAEEPAVERWIDIDRSSGAVTLYEGDGPISTLYASLSRSQGEDYYATATGTYYIYAMNNDLTYTDFAGNYITGWVGFDPDRRNGFHSYLKDANGYIVPGGDGYTGGCVALGPGDIDALFNFAEMGMRVEVHW